MMQLPFFSVIINTYNRAASLNATLNAISRLRWSSFEVVVVTGPSEDGTRAILQPWLSRIKHVECDKVNLAHSRNLGLLQASGDWFVFTDDDALPEPDWLCQIAAYILAHQHVKLGAVGGFVYDHTGRTFQAQYLISDVFGDSLFNVNDVLFFPRSTTPQSLIYPSLMGVNICYSRAALMDVGGFDTAFAYFLEETDLILRLVQKGWQVHNHPRARVHHKYADSHIRHEKKVTSYYHIMRSRAYFSIRHGLKQQSLNRVAQHHSHWLEDVRTHYPQLLSEAYTALHDGQQLAELAPQILKLSQVMTAPARPFVLDDTRNRLRVLLVSSELPPRQHGGIARFIHVLAVALVDLGHEVTIISKAESHESATVDLVNGYWLHRIHSLSVQQLAAFNRPMSLPDLPEDIDAFAAAVWQETVRIQEHRDFQLVIAGLWNAEAAYLQAVNLLPVYTYLVTSYHHMYAHYSYWQTERSRKMLMVEQWLFSVSNLLAGSQAIVQDAYQQSANVRLLMSEVIPFGLPDDVSRYSPSTISDESDCVHLLFVGRFEPRKGVDLLLSIAPKLLMNFPKLVITMIGNDQLAWHDEAPIKQRFIEQNSDLSRIHFLGEVSDEQLLKAYDMCDVFVAPSRYESFGLIYLEAMRAGKACVGTSVGGIPEVIEAGVTGLLAEADSEESLYLAIARLLEDQQLRKAMGRKARQRYERYFTDVVFAQRLVQYLQQQLCSAV